ncbi:hypothetical protein CFAM422_009922 [Trichoderma lentiforme]|uniref:Uncharacterized protein n=1 Tax=Trichoderma lentiforme TaxID=1567552 RepID=A0A9P4X6G4_9HYPO|nr:hypothetical protein CFAM422_009922 [Trichoderma lentiforme]
MASTSEQIRDLEGGGADRRAAKCVESSHRVRDIAEETETPTQREKWDARVTQQRSIINSHFLIWRLGALTENASVTGDVQQRARTSQG